MQPVESGRIATTLDTALHRHATHRAWKHHPRPLATCTPSRPSKPSPSGAAITPASTVTKRLWALFFIGFSLPKLDTKHGGEIGLKLGTNTRSILKLKPLPDERSQKMSQNNESEAANMIADGLGRLIQITTHIEAAVSRMVLLHFNELSDPHKKVFTHHLVSRPGFANRCDLLVDLLQTDLNKENYLAFKDTRNDKIKKLMEFRNKVVHNAIIPVPQPNAALVNPQGEYQVLSTKDEETGERTFVTETIRYVSFLMNIEIGLEVLGELDAIEKRLAASLTS